MSLKETLQKWPNSSDVLPTKPLMSRLDSSFLLLASAER